MWILLFVYSKSAVSVGNKESPNCTITNGNQIQKHVQPSIGQTAMDNDLEFSQPDSSTGTLTLEGEAEMLVHVSIKADPVPLLFFVPGLLFSPKNWSLPLSLAARLSSNNQTNHFPFPSNSFRFPHSLPFSFFISYPNPFSYHPVFLLDLFFPL